MTPADAALLVSLRAHEARTRAAERATAALDALPRGAYAPDLAAASLRATAEHATALACLAGQRRHCARASRGVACAP